MTTHSNEIPSERRFGLTFTALFVALALYGLLRSWDQRISIAWIAVGLALGLVTLLAPRRLAPLNRAWFRLGVLLNRVVSPLALSVIFFGLLTPIGYIARLFGRDELHLRRRTAPTYWISRDPPGPRGPSFRNQF